MPKYIKIGDIIEIPTSKGLAYAQFTHQHDKYGSLVRVLDGIYESRPKDIIELVNKKHRFMTFFPLSIAVKRKDFSVVGNADVPADVKDFPIFRGGAVGVDRKVATWWLWDGKKEWMIGSLTAEQRHFPIRMIVNLAGLIYMIESGWTPENDRR